MNSQTATDERYMSMALSLAQRGLGNTAPNPSVGCVIVKNDQVIGRGWTANGGRPHAETIAMQQSGRDAVESTVYVTLEPCSHHGKTGPCTDALIKTRVKRVVIGTQDPNPNVNGQGIEQLKKAGIEVTVGVLEEQANELHRAFFYSLEHKRPFVTLKLGMSLDGQIAISNGKSKWITCEEARNYSHLLRHQHDAIMIGIETVLDDDPSLICRLPGLDKSHPARIVMDSKLRTPSNAKLLQDTEKSPTYIFTTRQTSETARAPAKTIQIPPNSNNIIDVPSALKKCAELGFTNLLVEGGARLASSFMREDFVDRIEWIQAPKFIGNKGVHAIADIGYHLEAAALKPSPLFEIVEERRLGTDMLTVLEKRK